MKSKNLLDGSSIIRDAVAFGTKILEENQIFKNNQIKESHLHVPKYLVGVRVRIKGRDSLVCNCLHPIRVARSFSTNI